MKLIKELTKLPSIFLKLFLAGPPSYACVPTTDDAETTSPKTTSTTEKAGGSSGEGTGTDDKPPVSVSHQ